MFQVLNFSEMGTQIRIAWRAKYKMLSVVLDCFSRLQVKFSINYSHAHSFCSILFINIAYSGGYYLLESKFYFVVLNNFCESRLKIDGLFYFAKPGSTKIISSESKIMLTRPTLVLTYPQYN